MYVASSRFVFPRRSAPKAGSSPAELDLEGGEVAQIQGAYGLDHHGRLQTDAAYALSRIGITR